MEEALVARLKAAAGVGGVVAWGELPRAGALPSTMLTFIAPGREWTHEGVVGLERSRVQIDSWAATSVVALAAARAVLAEMETAVTIAGVVFEPAQLEGRMGPEPDDLTGGGKVWRVMQDFTFYHEPTGG